MTGRETMTEPPTVTAEDDAELQLLYEEYRVATNAAVKALRIGDHLDSIRIARFLEKDAEIGAVVRRIKDLLRINCPPANR